MKFVSTVTALSAIVAAEAATLGSGVACGPVDKSLVAYDRPFVDPLYRACLSSLGSSLEAHENPWISKTCVAAAIAATVSLSPTSSRCIISRRVTSSEPDIDIA